MKLFFFMLLLLAPLPALAVKLTDCDRNSYDVTVKNAGSERVARLTPKSSPIEEYGPMVSFRIEGQKEVVATTPYEEFCIWSGRILVQKMKTWGDNNGGGYSLR